MKKSKQKKRKKNLNLNYSVIAVLGILVIVGIALFLTNNNTEEAVAIVNGEKITASEISEIQQSFEMQGQQVSEEDALEQVINQKLVFQEAEKQNYSVSTEEAESVMESQLAMQGATLDDYKQELQKQDLSYNEEIENIKQQITIQQYLEAQFEDKDFEVSENESQEFYEMYKQQLPGNITYEEAEQQIIMTLQQQKQQQAINSLVQELKNKAEIEYL